MLTAPSSQIKIIALGSDHGGFELKEQLKSYLHQKGYEVEDTGTYKPVSVDYPLFAYKVAQKVASGECQRGIMVLRRNHRHQQPGA
jgi:ribose 5-phosphate isomerase B